MKDKRLKSLCKSIQAAVKKSCKENTTISFSGGVDSTLLALIAKNYCHTELITVGVKDSYDIKASKTAAKELGLNPKIVEKEPEGMIKEAEEMRKILNISPMEIEFMIPFWIAAKTATNKTLLCGQGADELFGGYARFRSGKKYNLSKEVRILEEIIPQREEKIAKFFGLKLYCPYLNREVIACANSYTQKERVGNVGKVPLRMAAKELGLSKEIADRKKKAAQYGSGSQKAIRSKMKYRIKLELGFRTVEIANTVINATEPENKGWVDTEIKGSTVNAILKATSLGSLRETFEDFMACVSVAEKVAQ